MSFKGFTSVKLNKPKRSLFDMSHERKTSCRMGKLVPILCEETLPNDTWKVKSEILIKLAPMIAPIFHRVNVFVHYFFVPMRLIEKDWETFITGGREGTSNLPPPYTTIKRILDLDKDYLDIGSLYDHLGGQTIKDSAGDFPTQRIVLRPFAAYQKVFWDYYRDRNFLNDATWLPLDNAELTNNTTVEALVYLRTRSWQRDYFTSALPWTQRGAEVLMPIEGSGDVTYLPATFATTSGGGAPATGNIKIGTLTQVEDSSSQSIKLHNIDHVDIDSSSVSINEFRRAVALQKWLERNALAGSRYTESILAHFGRRSSDARLQRAEYLGGGKAILKVDEVVTTAYSEDDDANVVPPAMPSGKAQAYSQVNGFTYNCEEHGFVLGIMSVMPKTGYFQGMPRKFAFATRSSRYDYPWPTFAHLGEQPVYDFEIVGTGAKVTDSDPPVFGYQSRYADWKTIHSSAHGDFRTTLRHWHLDRFFSVSPTLNQTFMLFEDALQDRIFNVSGVDTVWAYIHNSVKVVRPLPYFGTPQL